MVLIVGGKDLLQFTDCDLAAVGHVVVLPAENNPVLKDIISARATGLDVVGIVTIRSAIPAREAVQTDAVPGEYHP
jgi:hypothetical protein